MRLTVLNVVVNVFMPWIYLHFFTIKRCRLILLLLVLRLSARLFVLLGLIGGVMSHLDFQYISIVAWS